MSHKSFSQGAGVFRYDYVVKQSSSALQTQLEVPTPALDLLALSGCGLSRCAAGIALALGGVAHQCLHVG